MDKKNEKKLVFAFGIVTVLLLAGITTIILQPKPNNINQSTPPIIPPEKFLPSNIEVKQIYNPLVIEYNPITNDYRPKYNLTSQQFNDIFGQLPKFPKDLFELRTLFFKGILKDINRLNESYWSQPEWYYGWSPTMLKWYTNPNTMLWTPHGLGGFPEIVNYEVTPGSSFNVATILHTDYGVDSYQGVVLYYYYPSSARDVTGHIAFNQTISNAKRYIHVQILEPDHDPLYYNFKTKLENEGKYVGIDDENERMLVFPPSRYILSPTKVLGFPKDWVKKCVVKISVDKNCPKDSYVIALDFKNPPANLNTEYYWVYKLRYIWNTPEVIHRSYPLFQIIITVK